MTRKISFQVHFLCTDLSITRYTLTEQCEYQTIMQLYKILHKLAPVYLHDMISYTTSITGYVGKIPIIYLCHRYTQIMEGIVCIIMEPTHFPTQYDAYAALFNQFKSIF